MLSHSRLRHLTALTTPGGTWHSVHETWACVDVSQATPAGFVALHDMQYVEVSVAHTGITSTTARTAMKPTTTSIAIHGARYHRRGSGRYR